MKHNICNIFFIFSEIETFKEWLRYRYGVFPESGFEGDKIYPRQYDFSGEMRDSSGCKNIAPSPAKKPQNSAESRHRKSFNSDYKYDLSQTVTVPFLPNDESNGDDVPQLKLETFASTSFKVCV